MSILFDSVNGQYMAPIARIEIRYMKKKAMHRIEEGIWKTSLHAQLPG